MLRRWAESPRAPFAAPCRLPSACRHATARACPVSVDSRTLTALAPPVIHCLSRCQAIAVFLTWEFWQLILAVIQCLSRCQTLSCWLRNSDSLAILSYIVSLAVRHYLVDFSLAFLPYVVSLANTISLTSESWHPSPSYHTQSHSHGRRITHSKVLTSPSCHPLPRSPWHHLSESATLTVPPHPIHTSSRSRWRHIPIQQNRNTVHQLSWLGKDTLIITRYNYNC